jgi:hypothetical protein
VSIFDPACTPFLVLLSVDGARRMTPPGRPHPGGGGPRIPHAVRDSKKVMLITNLLLVAKKKEVQPRR